MSDEPDPRDPDVEVELVDAVSLPDVHAPETGSTDRGRRSGPLVVVGALLVALVGWIGYDAVLTDDAEETTAPTTTTPADPAPTTTTRPPDPTTTTTSTTIPTAPFPALRLLPDAPALDAPLAVVSVTGPDDVFETATADDNATLWLLDDGRAISRSGIPRLGAQPLFLGETFVVAGGDGMIEVDPLTGDARDLGFEGVGEDRVLLGFGRGSGPGEILIQSVGRDAVEGNAIMGDAPRYTGRLTVSADGLSAEELAVPEAAWSFYPAGDGLVLAMDDGLVRWEPNGGTAPLESVPGGSGYLAAAWGDLVLIGTPRGGETHVVDVRTDTLMASFPEPELSFGGCFDPVGRQVAFRHIVLPEDGSLDERLESETFVSLLDLARPGELRTIELGEPVLGLAWTSSGQFVAATSEHLLAVDVAAGEPSLVGEIAGADLWRIASAGGSC
ncbi:MAG: hypothetical protein S0880_16135 [Actinomycetota bacterium]|nr:hypothetical protein [Actinomycetota bacterium]